MLVIFSQNIEPALEVTSRVMSVAIIGYLAVVALFIVPNLPWRSLVKGFLGLGERGFRLFPEAPDFFLLSAFAAYSGASTINAALSYWVRDKGFGMSGGARSQEATVAGKTLRLSQAGMTFLPSGEAMRKWHGWWKLAARDQYCFWLPGGLIGMALPCLLAVASIPAGNDIRGPAVSAELAQGLSAMNGLLWWMTLVAGFWILFSTQIGIVDGFSQIVTDLLWNGIPRLRARGNPGPVYWGVMGALALAGALLLAAPLFGVRIQPILLIQLSANWAGISMVFFSVQMIIVNRKLLPASLRPPLWRQIALGLCACFFLAFTSAWLFNSPEAKTFAPYVVSFFLIAFLVGLGLGNFSGKAHARVEP